MPLVIQSRTADCLPISWQGLTPATVGGRALADIEKIPISYGNRKVPWGEFFRFSGGTDDGQWRLEGDFSSVHYIGSQLDRGMIVADGPVGRHAGSQMTAGELHLSSAGDYLGAEMRGGKVVVTGNTGDHTAAAYVGSKLGMRGGLVVVHGNVGSHAGSAMRRGMLIVTGDGGDWVGYRMRGGTIIVGREWGKCPGAELRRGTLIAAGAFPTLLPTFRYACRYRPSVLSWMHRELAASQIVLSYEAGAEFRLFNGDLNEGGRGEFLVI
jgi:formylmethanofuran dehydrogenase subunit C